MTCKDCLHEQCYQGDTDDIEICNFFIDKNRYVEVVRCKDCKHWGGIMFGNICRRWSSPLAGMKNCTKPDDFCSYGERWVNNED